MSKDFLTYNQQMKYLREKKKIDCNGTNDKSILCRAGYFNLINGYKTPFVTNTTDSGHVYINGTTLKEIYNLKEFDDDLRMHLLRYVTKVEEEIRTLVGYKFDEVNNKGRIYWFSMEAFDNTKQAQSIVRVIADAYHQVQKSEQAYVKHYFKEHKHIPTWIMVKVINFSTLIDLISVSKNMVKDSLCELYGIKDKDGYNDYKLLIGSLHWMRKVRNSCAHNERIYGMGAKNERILTPYFNLLPRSYTRCRDRMIVDLLVYMRYYLDNRNYKKFITEIKEMLLELQKDIKPAAFNKVRADLGIKDLSHLDILLSISKKIEYNKF